MIRNDEMLTKEQQEQLKHLYMISNERIVPIIPGAIPTRETLKIVGGTANSGAVLLEPKDFYLDSDRDYKYDIDKNGVGELIMRNKVPREVQEILDEIIMNQ